MVFNPVYIQKPSEGESQLFGSGIANQKTTYLFSDIIKVILSKTEQNGINVQTEKNGQVDQQTTDADVNSLIISDAEVELYEKLMKINLISADTSEIQKLISEDPSVLLESLQMYLTGLTNQNETTPIINKDFEIDDNDLAVVLNILAGNALKDNNYIEGNIEISKELSEFVAEINGILNSLEKNDEQYLLIKQNDISIELHPLQNGKVLVKISDQFKSNQIAQNISPDLKLEKTDVMISEKQDVIPTDLEKPESSSAKTESTVNAAPNFNAEEKNIKQTAAISEALKNNATKSGTVNSLSDNSVMMKKNSTKLDENAENKIVFQNNGAGEELGDKKVTSNVNKVDKMPESKEYFEGKIKVEVITVENDSARHEGKNNTIDVAKVTKLPVENNSVNVTATKTNTEITDGEKSKISSKTNVESANGIFSEKAAQTQDTTELPIEKDGEVKQSKQTGSKQEKLDIQKQTTELHNNSQKITTASSDIVTERQDQSINASIIDKKNQTEKENSSKSELNGVLSAKEKTSKTVTSNNETDKQKPDSQQQNNFEKIFANVSKTEHIGKEIKDSVKLVEQSRLMNEIENIIKSGERKAVTINLYPEELGAVKVSLDITDKSVSAKINVASDSIRQMILTQADSLKTSLNQSGIQLASLNVSVNNSEDKSTPHGKMKRKDGGTDKKLVISDLPNPVKVKNLGYNTYDYIA